MIVFVNDSKDLIQTIRAEDVKIEQGLGAETSYLNGNLVTMPPQEVEDTIRRNKGAAAVDFGRASGPNAVSWKAAQAEIASEQKQFQYGLRM